MNLSDINWPVILIALSGALILLLRDWRITVSALLVNYVGVAIFLAQQQFLQPDLQIGSIAVSTTVLVKLISGVAATAILAITALTFSREYNQEDLDDFRWPSYGAPRAAPSASAPPTAAPGRLCRAVLDSGTGSAGQHSAASALSDRRYQHYRFRLVLAGADWPVYHGGRRRPAQSWVGAAAMR